MGLNWPSPGTHNVAEYLASPIPWVTSSALAAGVTVRHDFPTVASSFAVQHYSTGSSGLSVGFTSDGVAGTKRVRVRPGAGFAADVRFKSLFLYNDGSASADYDLIVGLTGISPRSMEALSSSYTSV